jgi:hypothetical protein
MKKPILILLAFVFAMAGCKLDEAGFNQKSTPDATTGGALVGMWFIKTQITTGTALGFPINDTETTFTANDYYLFNSDNTVKVSTVDKGVGSGTYSYNAATKKLTISNADSGGIFTVSKLTADSLVMSTAIAIPALGTSTNITLKLTH